MKHALRVYIFRPDGRAEYHGTKFFETEGRFHGELCDAVQQTVDALGEIPGVGPVRPGWSVVGFKLDGDGKIDGTPVHAYRETNAREAAERMKARIEELEAELDELRPGVSKVREFDTWDALTEWADPLLGEGKTIYVDRRSDRPGDVFLYGARRPVRYLAFASEEELSDAERDEVFDAYLHDVRGVEEGG